MTTIDPFKIMIDLMLRLPRQGPGSARSTKAAFDLLDPLPQKPLIFDLGCGAGTQTLDLLDLTDGQIVAVDLLQPFLDILSDRAEAKHIPEHRLRTQTGDIGDLDLHGQQADLIWSEGAIYNIGVETGLTHWRQHLKPRGQIAFSEITWLTSTPNARAKSFWDEGYPDMKSVDENCAIAERLGYKVLGTYTLSKDDWWQDFYTPMKREIADMRIKLATELGAGRKILDNLEHEMEVFEQSDGDYSYVFYALKADD